MSVCRLLEREKPSSVTLGGLEAGRPHTPNTQMEAKCFIWWPLTNHTEPPLAANTQLLAGDMQAFIWEPLIALKVFTLIKVNSWDAPLRILREDGVNIPTETLQSATKKVVCDTEELHFTSHIKHFHCFIVKIKETISTRIWQHQ